MHTKKTEIKSVYSQNQNKSPYREVETKKKTFCCKEKISHSEIDPSMLEDNKRPCPALVELGGHHTSEDTLEFGSP